MTSVPPPAEAPAATPADPSPSGTPTGTVTKTTTATTATPEATGAAVAESANPSRSRRRRRSLGRPADRAALGIWFFWHVATYIYLYFAADGRTDAPLLDRLTPWDAENFITIAQWGYDGSPGMEDAPRLVAFFPGMPLLLRGLHVVIPNWDVAIVVVSLVASAVVAVALSRLSESYREGSGTWTVLAFYVSPFAVFLLAGYSEALFLALAVPAWLLARRGRWPAAAACAALACTVRVSGLFLALGLAVMFLVAENGRRAPGGWWKAPWLALPGIPVLIYMAYLWTRTGDLMAWKRAEAQYWGRYPEWPWQVLINTWERSVSEASLRTSYREEILAAAVLAVLICWQLVRRRWADFAYLAPQGMALLAMSSFYMSVGRASLLWWPLYLSVGILAARRWWVFMAYAAIAAPVMAINVGNFTTGAWVG